MVPAQQSDRATGHRQDRCRLSGCLGRRGARPASLGRYQASIAKIHQLLDLKDSAQGNQRAFDAGGLNQDLFVSGEDLAGIMDALRRKSPLMPLAYNRNLAAEAGVVGRLTKRLE